MIVHMIGNAHIDPVWLWRWQAGVDEALASFRSAADRCDEYPEFIHTRGEAWLYEQVERIDPALLARVKELVERGQWHITGGQYIQPDVNLVTEMNLRRQIIHGQRYFEERFGVSPKVGYNVDSFGHPATLPDILAACGYLAYVFHRPKPNQLALSRPTFRWRGVGGGEVIGFRILPGYTTRKDDLYDQIMISVEAADEALGHTMCFYGVGNHGGGPTKGNIAYILEHARAFEGIELRFSTPQAFFEAVLPQRDKLPLVTEELQRTFPGCYSVMHDIKREQRHGEQLLDQASRVVESMAEMERREELQKRLDRAWEDLLFTSFHDILAGTSIPSAWPSVRAMQGRARITAEEVIVETTRRWARQALPKVNHQQIIVVNPDKSSWRGFVEAEPWFDFDSWQDRWLSDLDGRPIEFQLVQPEAQQLVSRVVFPAEIGAGGSLQVLVRDDAGPETPDGSSDLEVSEKGLRNDYLQLDLAEGGIKRLRAGGRDLLGERGITFHLRHDHTDTWTFHTDRFEEPIAERFKGSGWTVEETGPLRARVRTEGRLGNSSLRWTVSLCQSEPRLFMTLEIVFDERLKLLQMPVQLAAAPGEWLDGLAAGQVRRGPSPVEWPVQGWSRVPVRDHMLALVTNDAYSLSLNDDLWQWTLLRSPKMAWGGGQPDVYAGHDHYTDQGKHVFAFELRVRESLEPLELHTAARQQAQNLIVFDRYDGLDRPLWGSHRDQVAPTLFRRQDEQGPE